MYPSPLRLLAGAASLLLVGFAAAPAAAQTTAYSIRGSVVDATSQRPLPGVAVSLRNSQSRTVTDAAGRYNLGARVAAGTYTLQFSIVGRGTTTRQVTLGADAAVEVAPVSLSESAVELEGLVVTGTGAPVERRQVGNTVATVSGEAINQAPAATSVDRALQGRIAGAVISQNSGQPGGGSTIRLRGTSSILGGADPLIVIDGVLIDNNNSALIGLGSNASRAGTAVSNRLSDIAPGDIERVEVLKGAAAAALYGSRANNGVIQIFTKRGVQGRPQVTFSTEAIASETPSQYPVLMLPQAGPGDTVYLRKADNTFYRVGDPIERYNIQDQIFRTGYGTQNQLSVSGGSEGTSYYLSGSWINQEGIIRETSHDKRSVRGKITQQLGSALEVTVNGSYIQSETQFQPEGEQTQGALTAALFTPTGFNYAFDPALGRFPYSPIVTVNPLQVLNEIRAEANVDRFIGSFQASLTPLPDVTLSYLFGLDDAQEENIFLQPPYTVSGSFTGSIQNPVRSIRKYNHDVTANWDWNVRQGLGLATTAGFRYTSDRNNVVRSGAEGLPPGQGTVGGATQFASQSVVEFRTAGGFLQQRLSLGDRLFLTGGLNYEGSSAFGEDERYQLFPRLGASWVVNEMPFWDGNPAANLFSTLRVRASYGETGGQPPAAYSIFNNYIDGLFGGRPGQVGSTILANADLKPERQREVEAGFDAGLFNDRAQLEFTYYTRRTSDLVLSVPLHPSSGYSEQFQNIGEISNRGIEASLSGTLLRRSGFNWDARLNYARDRNEVERLRTSSDTLVFEYLNAVVEGQPVGVFYGAELERDPNTGELVLTNGRPRRARTTDGRIRNTILGDPNPDWTASLSNSFTVRNNLEFSFLLDGRFGNDVANFTRRIQDYFGLSQATEREIRGEVAAGYHTLNIERHLAYEAFVEDGSFVKLREAAIRYRFDQPWVRRTGAESLDLRIAGRNLHTWTSYSGVDPEINLFAGSTVARGVDFVTTPIPRSVSVGFTVNF